jgi:transposase InsO family protein
MAQSLNKDIINPAAFTIYRDTGVVLYLPTAKGFAYLVAIIDWQSRKILSWQVSNVIDTDFCVEALNTAIDRYGVFLA